MNAFDVLVLLFVLSAMLAGWRIGLLARALSWVGLGVGLVLAAQLAPRLLSAVGATTPASRLLYALGALLVGAVVGQTLGLFAGSRMHLALPETRRPFDKAAGAVVGGFGVLVMVWLFLPVLAVVPGAPSDLALNSAIANAVDDVAPDAPDPFIALRRLVGSDRFPQVFSTLRPAPDLGPTPFESGLAGETLAAVTRSVFRVEAEACSRLQEGSGFVAEPGVVVTNAHVVAGASGSRVELFGSDGSRTDAIVVTFDPDRDLAVLAAPGLAAPALDSGPVDVGGVGGVVGFPGGGSLEVSPFEVRSEVEAIGRDLYDRHDTSRQILILSAAIAPGDSGAALVDPEGRVLGVAFATAPDEPGTAYALDGVELAGVLDTPRNSGGVDTGPCIG